MNKRPEITNNQAEYLAIIAALKKFVDSTEEITIYSDSKNTVNQLNHEFAINNEQLRNLAREAWSLIGKFSSLSIEWIPRKNNLSRKNAWKLKNHRSKISMNNFIHNYLNSNSYGRICLFITKINCSNWCI